MNELANAIIGNSAAAPADHIIEGLDEKHVHRAITNSPHTIYQELWHVTFWQQVSLDWVNGIETPIPAHAAEQFPTVAQAKAESWEQLCARFLRGANEAAAVAAETDKLEREIVCPSAEGRAPRTMTVRDQLVSLAAHNAYHLGRVVLLRQMMGAWPPPSGGFKW